MEEDTGRVHSQTAIRPTKIAFLTIPVRSSIPGLKPIGMFPKQEHRMALGLWSRHIKTPVNAHSISIVAYIPRRRVTGNRSRQIDDNSSNGIANGRYHRSPSGTNRRVDVMRAKSPNAKTLPMVATSNTQTTTSGTTHRRNTSTRENLMM